MAVPILRSERVWPPGARRAVIDHEHGVVKLEMTDGTVVLSKMRAPRADDFLRSEYNIERGELLLVLVSGETIEVEARATSIGSPNRPVVYLDQWAWIELARFLHAPDKARSSEREACARIVELARSRQILLPLSGAHLSEAARRGRRRRDLVMTMLELSRGWQMRSPVDVRQRELRDALRAHAGHPRAGRDSGWPFSVEPNVLFMRGARDSDAPLPSQLPPPLRDLKERLTGISTFIAAALEDDDTQRASEPGSKWTEVHRRLGEHDRDARLSREQTRLNVLGLVLGDLSDELARIAKSEALTPEQFAGWLPGAEASIAGLPFLGRLFEVTYDRFRDRTNRWKDNDLFDLMYLCSAAGYADIVVGEKKTAVNLIRAGRKQQGGSRVFDSLNDAAVAIDEGEPPLALSATSNA